MKIKDFLSKKKLNMKSASEFFEKKGFYIVLVLCVAVVGATAVFVTTRNMGTLEEDYRVDNLLSEEQADEVSANTGGKAAVQSSINQEAQTSVIARVDSVKPEAKAAASVEEKVWDTQAAKTNISGPKPTAAPAAPAKTEAEKAGFTNPVFGEITYDYSMDKLSYSKTLGDWRTHNGVDIASDRGTPVKSAADGYVSDIKKDPRYGITVIVEHSNGYRSVYANLAGEDMVTVNQKIKQGDVIGSVGNTALFECAEASHLHFEVAVNGVTKDPKTYLPKK